MRFRSFECHRRRGDGLRCRLSRAAPATSIPAFPSRAREALAAPACRTAPSRPRRPPSTTVKMAMSDYGAVSACASAPCHGAGGMAPPVNPLTLQQDANLYTNMMTYVSHACGDIPLVNPGKPDESALIKILTGPCGTHDSDAVRLHRRPVPVRRRDCRDLGVDRQLRPATVGRQGPSGLRPLRVRAWTIAWSSRAAAGGGGLGAAAPAAASSRAIRSRDMICAAASRAARLILPMSTWLWAISFEICCSSSRFPVLNAASSRLVSHATLASVVPRASSAA